MDFNDRRPVQPDTTELAGHVKKARSSITALGRLNLGTRPGFNAAMRHQSTIKEAHEALYDAGRHDLVGALIDEQNTHERLREAKAKGQERPELQQRLKSARAATRNLGASSQDAVLQRHFDSHSGDQAECRDAACQAAMRPEQRRKP